MDRKGKQKITIALFVTLGALLVLALVCAGIGAEYSIHQEQMEELEILYPELGDALQENVAFYEAQSIKTGIVVGISTVTLFLLILGLLLWYAGRSEKRSSADEQQKLAILYQQINQFQQGDFAMVSSWEETSSKGQWEGVYDKLQELAYALSDMKNRLQEEENSTKALVTDISHQLKTPLASIRMCHELAQSSDLGREEQEEFLATETREIAKMEMLLDELVKLSRLENNMIQIQPKMESLEQTLSEAVGQIYMKAHTKNIELSVDMVEDVNLLHDRKWTVEALVNVLDNGVKYSTENTEIHITVKILANSVLLEIADEGIGIPEEECHAIFQRFYRGEIAKKTAKEGAGVGLYLTRKIIEKQGGSIVAKKNPGGGTIFNIMLPR